MHGWMNVRMNGCVDGLTGALSYSTIKAKGFKIKQLIIAAALMFATATIIMYVHGFCKVIQLFLFTKVRVTRQFL